MRKKALVFILVPLCLAAGSAGAWYLYKNQPAPPTASPDAQPSGGRVVAKVGQTLIRDDDFQFIPNGGERAVMVDRLVTVAVAAEQAEAEFKAEADLAGARARRDALATLYIQKKSQQLRAALKPAEIKAYYASEVTPDQFASYKASFVSSQDAREIEALASAIAEGGGASQAAQFKALGGGDGFVPIAQIPLGIGNVLRQMKPGQFSQPVVMRNGIFLLRLDDVRPGKVPSLEEMTPSISDMLVARQLDATFHEAKKRIGVSIY